MKIQTRPRTRFAVCVDNTGYPSSLERRKLYKLLPDPDAEAHDQVRVVDESGEDYLFPASYFREVKLPVAVIRLFGKRAKKVRVRLNSRAAVQRSIKKAAGRGTHNKAHNKGS